MVKSLIDCVKEYKNTCEFNSIDFNSNKLKLYEEVRKRMALIYEESAMKISTAIDNTTVRLESKNNIDC